MTKHIVKLSYRRDFQRGSHEEHEEVCAELVVAEYDSLEKQLLAIQSWVNSIGRQESLTEDIAQ